MRYKKLVESHIQEGHDEVRTVVQGLEHSNITPKRALEILKGVSKRFEVIKEAISVE